MPDRSRLIDAYLDGRCTIIEPCARNQSSCLVDPRSLYFRIFEGQPLWRSDTSEFR